MSEYRVVKTRWFHRAWDYFFKPDKPTGFEIGMLVCNLHLDGKTGPLRRIGPSNPGYYSINVKGPDEHAKEIKNMRSHLPKPKIKGREGEVLKQERALPSVLSEALVDDSPRTSRRSMGWLPGRKGRY